MIRTIQSLCNLQDHPLSHSIPVPPALDSLLHTLLKGFKLCISAGQGICEFDTDTLQVHVVLVGEVGGVVVDEGVAEVFGTAAAPKALGDHRLNDLL